MSDPVTVYNSGFNLKLGFQLVQLTSANLATNNFLSLLKNIDEITVTPNVSSILQWLKSPTLNYFIFAGVS